MVSSWSVISACINEDVEALKRYHAQGVDFNKIYDSVGDPLLHIAIKYDSPKSFDTLIELGVNIEICETYFNMTALNYAALYNSVDFAEKLISAGANVNTQDSTGYTPLNNAFFFQSYETANYLLDNPNVDVNITGYKTPPLYWAYIDGEWATVQKIISHPQYDPTYEYIIFSEAAPVSTIAAEIAAYLKAYGPPINDDMVELYHELQLIGLKYDLSGSILFSELENHGNYIFSFNEGYYNEVGMQHIGSSFDAFYQAVDNSGIPEWAKEAFSIVHESVIFSQNTTDPNAYYNKIIAGDPVLIPSGWDQHSIGVVIHGDHLYLCNRGDESDGIHGIYEFLITNAGNLTPLLIDYMLKAAGPSSDFNQNVIEGLALESIGLVENPTQTVGNCVWTSLETSVEALFITTLIDQGLDSQSAHALAKQNFTLWENYDLDTSLQQIVTDPQLLLQNEFYDDLLIDIIEAHHNANDIAEVARGVFIFNQLNEPSVFATFDERIVQTVLEYDPQSYESISYLSSYAPAEPVIPTYYEVISGWLFPRTIDLSPEEQVLAREYLDFLVACDQYQATHEPALSNLEFTLNQSIGELFNPMPVIQESLVYV